MDLFVLFFALLGLVYSVLSLIELFFVSEPRPQVRHQEKEPKSEYYVSKHGEIWIVYCNYNTCLGCSGIEDSRWANESDAFTHCDFLNGPNSMHFRSDFES